MYIARQAIYNRSLKVYGYELLYRKGNQSEGFDGLSSTRASASVLGGLFESGIYQIVDDKYAFVNFDDELINSIALELIDPKQLVIEVLETIHVNERLIERLDFLKNKGYKIALDDFVEDLKSYPLSPYADIIKFDLIATPLDTISVNIKEALLQKKILLAEKVETEGEFQQAKRMGFHLFQGYYFSKPLLVNESKSHKSTKAQYLRLLNELKKEEPSYQKLAEIIEKDANLSYRLIKLSSLRSGTELIYSIKSALAYMGLNEIERWISILMLREMNTSKPDELMRISLIRTKFAELISIHSKYEKLKFSASIMGLFSVIDVMLNQKMVDALKDIALSTPITDALLYRKGELYPIYKIITVYETGDWEETEKISKDIGIDEKDIFNDYLYAVKWTREIMEELK
ncbi:MAG: EAL domain-containing protein [Mobilitalea sp.]